MKDKLSLILALVLFVIAAMPAAAGVTPAPAAQTCDPSSAIGSNFNGTRIANGDHIWFNAIVKVKGASHGTRLEFTNQTITMQVPGTGLVEVTDIPDGVVIFDAAATVASTVFVDTPSSWVTTVPTNYSGNVFLSGYQYLVEEDPGLPGGVKPVTWSGDFRSTPGITKVDWKWAAAVYDTPVGVNFDYNEIGVKPVDGSKLSVFPNSDHAGTPEYRKEYVIGGARGGGGSNYTGSLSGTKSKVPCPF